MNTLNSFKSQVLNTGDDSKTIFIRLITGLIFISEGIQKYLIVTMYGPLFFQQIGFSNPQFWVYFTGTFEILCGILVLFGLFTRLASIPLITIMVFAFVKTKLPLLATNGFWTFTHEYSTEFSLTLLLIVLLIYGGGKWSADRKILHSENS
jgi:putative oxidoreductase